MQRNRKMFLILCSIIFFFLFFATVNAQPLGITPPQPKQTTYQILAAENGRFVFGQISDSSSDQFMLDTLTGRLWRVTKSGEIGMYLIKVPYRHEDGKYEALPERIPDPRKRK